MAAGGVIVRARFRRLDCPFCWVVLPPGMLDTAPIRSGSQEGGSAFLCCVSGQERTGMAKRGCQGWMPAIESLAATEGRTGEVWKLARKFECSVQPKLALSRGRTGDEEGDEEKNQVGQTEKQEGHGPLLPGQRPTYACG